MTDPNSISVKQVDLSKYDILNILKHSQPLMKSNIAEHIINTHHTYNGFETNIEILLTLITTRNSLKLLIFDLSEGYSKAKISS